MRMNLSIISVDSALLVKVVRKREKQTWFSSVFVSSFSLALLRLKDCLPYSFFAINALPQAQSWDSLNIWSVNEEVVS